MGFENWTVKAGAPHVEPPFDLIERMVTARIHIDPVPAGNAPLLIAPGSHASGRIAEGEIDTVVQRCGTHACLADAGDVWLYRTAILHRSDRSVGEGRRRVLQVDFAAEELPGGLEWLGVG
jgi:ectoine hydroxylase-related dioxygenase (phytanoyl-CoA dioxygenase family)